jgi:hypothetical protein
MTYAALCANVLIDGHCLRRWHLTSHIKEIQSLIHPHLTFKPRQDAIQTSNSSHPHISQAMLLHHLLSHDDPQETKSTRDTQTFTLRFLSGSLVFRDQCHETRYGSFKGGWDDRGSEDLCSQDCDLVDGGSCCFGDVGCRWELGYEGWRGQYWKVRRRLWMRIDVSCGYGVLPVVHEPLLRLELHYE